MRIISLFLNQDDAEILLSWLADQPDLAFLMPVSEGCWHATDKLEVVPDFAFDVWHIRAGCLPHYPAGASRPTGPIEDPFRGWCGRSERLIPTRAFLGDTPKVLQVKINLKGKYSWVNLERVFPNTDNTIGQSSIAWIGNHFSMLGDAPHPETEQLWRRLRKFIRSNSRLIKAADILPKADVHAFPGALSEITSGRKRSLLVD